MKAPADHSDVDDVCDKTSIRRNGQRVWVALCLPQATLTVVVVTDEHNKDYKVFKTTHEHIAQCMHLRWGHRGISVCALG